MVDQAITFDTNQNKSYGVISCLVNRPVYCPWVKVRCSDISSINITRDTGNTWECKLPLS